MKFFKKILILILFSYLYSNNDGYKYPTDYPKLTTNHTDCKEIEGVFIDPDFGRYEIREEYKQYPTAQEIYRVFNLKPSETNSGDFSVDSRKFSLSFDENKSLVLNYYIDDNLYFSKKFNSSDLSCSKEGLTLITQHGQKYKIDLLPGFAYETQNILLSKVNNGLVVTHNRNIYWGYLYIIPSFSNEIRWIYYPSVDSKLELYPEKKEILENECMLHDAKSCGFLGKMYINGVGVDQDNSKAKFFLNKSCLMGEKSACILKNKLKD